MCQMPITRAPELDEALASGLQLQVLGQSARSGPEEGVAVAAVLAGTVRTPPAITARFRTARRAGHLYVLNDAGTARFLISPGVLSQVVISAGSWPLVLPVIGPRAKPIPAADTARLQADLDLFCAVVDVAAGGVDLELRATGITVDRAFST